MADQFMFGATEKEQQCISNVLYW